MSTIRFVPNASIEPNAIAELLEAVGWEGYDEDYPAALKGYWSTISGFDASGAFIAWCAILSGGIRHAVLIDVIVHPDWKRHGIGQALVTEAISHILAHGISIIHVDFEQENMAFYELCGLNAGLGGIYTGE